MINIDQATGGDCPAIAEIADQWRFGRTPGDRTASGFLMFSGTSDHYRACTSRTDLFFVAREATAVRGFLLAYRARQIPKDDEFSLGVRRELIADSDDDDVILIKQVATHPGVQRAGIGRMLYEHLTLRARPGTAFFAAVVADPANEASSRFHSMLGFQQVAERVHPVDGRRRAVWVRR